MNFELEWQTAATHAWHRHPTLHMQLKVSFMAMAVRGKPGWHMFCVCKNLPR